MQEGAFILRLGGEAIECPPLTIGQVLDLAANLGDNLEILRIALEPARPGITKDDIRAKRGGVKMLRAAVEEVLAAGEFLNPASGKGEASGDAPSGEAGAASA